MATRFVNADQRRRMAELRAKAEAEQKKAADAIRQQKGEKEVEKRTARAPSTAEGSTGGAAGSSKDKGKQKEVVSGIRRKVRSQGPPPSERATAPPVSAEPVVVTEDPEDAPLVKRPRREREPRVSDTAIGDMTGLSQVSFPGVFPEFFSLNTSEFFVASEDSKDLDEVDSVVQDRPSARTSSSAQGPLESLAGLDAEAASRRKEVLRAQLRQEEKLVGPFTTNLNEFMSAFPRGDTDILRKAVRETGQALSTVMAALLSSRETQRQLAVSENMLIQRDRETEMFKKRSLSTEECLAKAEEARKGAQEAAAQFKLEMQEAQRRALEEKRLREEAEKAKLAAEEEIVKLKRDLKEAQDSLNAANVRLEEEKARAQQHLAAELAKKDKAHAEAMEAALAESAKTVKDRTEEEYSQHVWDTLAQYLPAFLPGFDYPGFKAFTEAQIQAELDNLAALEVAAEGGMPEDPKQ